MFKGRFEMDGYTFILLVITLFLVLLTGNMLKVMVQSAGGNLPRSGKDSGNQEQYHEQNT